MQQNWYGSQIEFVPNQVQFIKEMNGIGQLWKYQKIWLLEWKESLSYFDVVKIVKIQLFQCLCITGAEGIGLTKIN